MKVRIYDDVHEYCILSGDSPDHLGTEVEVPEEVLDRWRKTREEYTNVQKEMAGYVARAKQ